MGFLEAIVKFFQTGGAFMYPILIVFAIGLAIAIERWIKTGDRASRQSSRLDRSSPGARNR